MKNKSKGVLKIYKPLGISPLDAIKIIKDQNPKLRKVKMTYAGRLDPMAEGLILVIVGKELSNFKKHLKHDKKYRAEIIFGFSTDTYDVLGIPEKEKSNLSESKIKGVLDSIPKRYKFKVPPFSSYRIKGKPLFKWALDKRLDEIEIPEKNSLIYSLNYKKTTEIKKTDLKKEINLKLKRVVGDFRQEKIIKKWNDLLEKDNRGSFLRVTLNIHCSSGFYVRSLANDIGNKLNTGGFLYNLKRTAINCWTVEEAVSPFKFKN